ncbi:hypothetical protein NE237_028140 [Protea cynaroides]|uniref:F-box associated beta-propeller type 3 domain-containing protein n=1 Tax=Protea cynaroides TaxID=273540 RepID=A0A9Q0GRF7_9MAGN|nr:hypothetical protein NE237_028140 [Protea cynaroides]
MMNGEGDHCKTRQIPLGFETIEKRLFDIVGSCNGFICLLSRTRTDPIYIYNPVTEEAILLPISHLKNSPLTTTSVGFGFDRLSNKYKLVRLHEIPPMFVEDYKNYERFAQIITVGANTYWRKLDFPKSFRFYYGVCLVFLDGILYWLVYEVPFSPCCGNIVAVDIENEKYWTIECPPLRYSSRKRKSLIHMDGSLAIIDYSSNKTMGFSFNLTTYDMSGLIYPQHIYDVPVLHMIYQQRFEFLVPTLKSLNAEIDIVRTGKQCQEQWHNHLCMNIKVNSQTPLVFS